MRLPLRLGLASSLALGLSVALSAQESVALYEVTFDATWSAATHPIGFPAGAHFSSLIGGTHNASVTFWEDGGIASSGIESMAESGSISGLLSEVNTAIAAGTAGEAIIGDDVPVSPGSTLTTFEVTSDHPLVTLTTMIAPSPDWFVGVHGLDLFPGGQWADDVVVPLLAYDAGTDSGTTFTAPNSDTNPQDPIALKTGGPFAGLVPLGTFTFRRLSSVMRFGSGINPPDSIAYSGTLPTISLDATLELHDPTGTMGIPCTTVLAVGVTPLPGFPAGIPLPNLGLSGPGSVGELLIGSFDVLITGPLWTGTPAAVTAAIPNDINLIGQTVYSQGVLIDPSMRLGLTDGMALMIRR